MTRRTFARLFGYTAGLACCLPILSGCNTATVATFVTTIAKYAAQLATYFSAGSLATQITTSGCAGRYRHPSVAERFGCV